MNSVWTINTNVFQRLWGKRLRNHCFSCFIKRLTHSICSVTKRPEGQVNAATWTTIQKYGIIYAIRPKLICVFFFWPTEKKHKHGKRKKNNPAYENCTLWFFSKRWRIDIVFFAWRNKTHIFFLNLTHSSWHQCSGLPCRVCTDLCLISCHFRG